MKPSTAVAESSPSVTPASGLVRKGRLPGTEVPTTWGAKHWTHRMPERVPRGEKRYGHKLTWASVREMRRAHALGCSARALAKRYGVCAKTALEIVTGRKWKPLGAVGVRKAAADGGRS